MKMFSFIMAFFFLGLIINNRPAPNRKMASVEAVIDVYAPAITESALSVLEEAQQKAQTKLISGEENVTVILHAGSYYLDQTFELGAGDGSSTGRVTWKAAEGERVRILGAQPLSLKPLNDSDLPFQAAIRPNVKYAKFPKEKLRGMDSQGFALPIGPAPSEIFFDGKPLNRSRHPNKDWLHIASSTDNQKFKVDAEIKFDPKINDAWFYGYWGIDWADQRIKVGSIDQDEFSLLAPLPVYVMKAKQRIALLNTFEYLDEPGEFVISQEGEIFIYPRDHEGEYLVSLTSVPLIRIKDASNVSFVGIEIGLTSGRAIEVLGGANVSLSSNLIRATGMESVNIRGGTGHSVTGNRFLDSGNESLIMEGGDRKTLTPSGQIISNNEFYGFSRIGRTNHPAVEIFGVGTKVSNNQFAHGPHFAIRFNGNEHLIELNHAWDVVKETSDAGAFYIGRDWSMRGNIVRFNYIHDLGSSVGGPGSMGVYMDDMASGTTVYGNYFFNAGRCAFIGGGRDNHIENNIFVNCKNSVHLDNRGQTWKVDWFNGPNINMMSKLSAVHYNEPPYSVKYPELVNVLNEEPLKPLGVTMKNNLMIASPAKLYLNPVLEEGNLEIEMAAPPELPTPKDFMQFIQAAESTMPEGHKRVPGEEMGLMDSEPHRALLIKQFGL